MIDHAHSRTLQQIRPVYLSVSRRIVWRLLGGAALGILIAAASLPFYADGFKRILLGYLVAFAFALSLSLGSLFFVLLQHLTRAGWSVVVRRPAEIFALNLTTVLILFLPLGWAVWNGKLYPWASLTGPTHAAHSFNQELVSDATNIGAQLYVHQTVDELTRSKLDWLNRPAFLLRVGLYFLTWILIAGAYFRWSRRQDLQASAVDETRRMERIAGLAMIAFGLTLTFAAFDLLMSLDPHWYSTIFGVYFFAGCAVGGISLILLVHLLLIRWHLLPDLLTVEHSRDLGRLLFAFVIFWAYIAFSQYMLLWYANIPETTRWLAVRGVSVAAGFGNSWGYLLVALLFGNFLIPFLGIMSRHVKADQRAMLFWTIWLLVFHYLDLYWLVMPELGSQLTIGPIELGAWLAVNCIYLLGASLIATRTSLLAVGDPRFNESLGATEVY